MDMAHRHNRRGTLFPLPHAVHLSYTDKCPFALSLRGHLSMNLRAKGR